MVGPVDRVYAAALVNQDELEEVVRMGRHRVEHVPTIQALDLYTDRVGVARRAA